MRWLDRAFFYVGEKEIKGVQNNAKIVGWWEKIKAPFRDDETPWCAAFVGGVLEECGITSSRSASARSYLKWGRELESATVGCIVVFWRGNPDGWSGHVGFLVGRDLWGNLLVLGGNQGDQVCIKAFRPDRVLGYRWPVGEALPEAVGLARVPLITKTMPLSTNEA